MDSKMSDKLCDVSIQETLSLNNFYGKNAIKKLSNGTIASVNKDQISSTENGTSNTTLPRRSTRKKYTRQILCESQNVGHHVKKSKKTKSSGGKKSTQVNHDNSPKTSTRLKERKENNSMIEEDDYVSTNSDNDSSWSCSSDWSCRTMKMSRTKTRRKGKSSEVKKRIIPKRGASKGAAKKVASICKYFNLEDEKVKRKKIYIRKEIKSENFEPGTPPTPKFSKYEEAAKAKVADRIAFLKSLNMFQDSGSGT